MRSVTRYPPTTLKAARATAEVPSAIVSGLSAGDKVVASGGFLFKSDILREKMGAGCAD